MSSLATPAIAADTDSPNPWLAAMPLLFVLIWSTGFVVAKFGLPYAPPLTFLLLRFALLWSVFALSIGAICLLFALIRKSAATRVTSLLYLTPPTTAVMAWLMFGEAFSIIGMFGMFGMVLAVIGVAFVVKK